MNRPNIPTGSLTVTAEMRALSERPGHLARSEGGQRLRELYSAESLNFKPEKLSSFGTLCFIGYLKGVQKAVEEGTAPDLTGSETPYRWGYIALTVFGCQRVVTQPEKRPYPKRPGMHVEVLGYLIKMGAPMDLRDIAGLTALHHACIQACVPALVRAMLEAGANPDWLDKYGGPPLYGACMTKQVEAVELLMEFGASIDIKDADNFSMGPTNFVNFGPEVTASIQRWLRKRRGESAPLDGGGCDSCGKQPRLEDKKFSLCSACKLVRYCSKDCQRSHWPQHKVTCNPASQANTVEFKPHYQHLSKGLMSLLPTAELVRQQLGTTRRTAQDVPDKLSKTPHTLSPTSDPFVDTAGKGMIVKVQIPYAPMVGTKAGAPDPAGPGPQDLLLVYNRRRDFMCHLSPTHNPTACRAIVKVIQEKGVRGAKAYFRAELPSADRLIIRISEVLAEQPF